MPISEYYLSGNASDSRTFPVSFANSAKWKNKKFSKSNRFTIYSSIFILHLPRKLIIYSSYFPSEFYSIHSFSFVNKYQLSGYYVLNKKMKRKATMTGNYAQGLHSNNCLEYLSLCTNSIVN